MKNKQRRNLEDYALKIQQIENKIEAAINQGEVERVIELVDNRGRLLNIIEVYAKKNDSSDSNLEKIIKELNQNVQDFNQRISPKLVTLRDNIGQQIAQTYKSKVSLRGYKSDNVRP